MEIPSPPLITGCEASQLHWLQLHTHRNARLLFHRVCSGLHPGTPELLCSRLTSESSSHHLAMIMARGKLSDLPGQCAITCTLIPAASTSISSVQVLDFESICPLIRYGCLLCSSCSSGQCFACGFLQIPPHDGHPCRLANRSPCRAGRGLPITFCK